jgi:protein-S-isoprenylcysteine O-methyltransferase Ste14
MLTAIGWLISVTAGFGPGNVGFALLIAWGVQVVAFAALEHRLSRRRDATRAWIAGVVARAATLLAALLASVIGLVPQEAAVAYGVGLTMLIILEAAWLALGSVSPGPKDR